MINLKEPSLRSMRENHECFHKLLLLLNFHCCVVATTIAPQPTDFSSFKLPNSTLKVSLRIYTVWLPQVHHLKAF